MAQIPLRNRAGDVVAWVKVNDVDYRTLIAWRWSPLRRGTVVVYAKRNLGKGVIQLMHRQIMGLSPGEDLNVDHRNGDGLDNRRANLRFATQAENLQNIRAKGASRHRGVSFRKDTGRWVAKVTVKGKTTIVGNFDDEDAAGAAATEARKGLMPFSQETR